MFQGLIGSMPLQLSHIGEMPLQKSNMEKCHYNFFIPLTMPFCSFKDITIQKIHVFCVNCSNYHTTPEPNFPQQFLVNLVPKISKTNFGQKI
jgi:hypothetical protein